MSDTLHIDLCAQCGACGLAFRVSGDITYTLYYELSEALPCPRCAGHMLWKTTFNGFVREKLRPEKFYRLVKGMESLEERPNPEAVASMLTTYRINGVLLDGAAIKELRLDCGVTLHLSVTPAGPFVYKLTREET